LFVFVFVCFFLFFFVLALAQLLETALTPSEEEKLGTCVVNGERKCWSLDYQFRSRFRAFSLHYKNKTTTLDKAFESCPTVYPNQPQICEFILTQVEAEERLWAEFLPNQTNPFFAHQVSLRSGIPLLVVSSVCIVACLVIGLLAILVYRSVSQILLLLILACVFCSACLILTGA
jgi:hypothetical protein